MTQPRYRLALFSIVFLLAGGAIATHAEEAPKIPVELVPVIGVRGGADLEANVPAVPPATANPSLSFGLEADFFVRPDAWFSVSADHQSLDFTSDPSSFGVSSFNFSVDYLQFGGGYGPAEGRARPYVTATVGLTHYGSSANVVGTAVGFSGSLGGGVKVPVSKRLALRFEVRGYATTTDAAVSVTCGAGCFVQFGASGWYQVAGTVGLSIKLGPTSARSPAHRQ